jgi:hypothetical protein
MLLVVEASLNPMQLRCAKHGRRKSMVIIGIHTRGLQKIILLR